MNKFRHMLMICSLIIVSLTLAAIAAHAQTAQRTFVSTSGNDANTASLCGANNPCRGFAAALTVTTAGGEIIALTSGGYGAVTITKSVQITAPTGVYAAITQSGAGDAVTVNAGSADTVVLKGLTLNGINGASNGIDWNTGATLHIESCTINGFGTGSGNEAGILFNAAGKLFVKDTIVRNGGRFGLSLSAPAEDAVNASIDRSRFENNGASGVLIGANARAAVTHSIAAGNGDTGFLSSDGGSATLRDCAATKNNIDGFGAAFGGEMAVSHSSAAYNSPVTARGFRAYVGGKMNIDNCTAVGNWMGIAAADQNTVLRVSNSTVTGNGIGFFQGNNALFEYYDRTNYLRGNATLKQGSVNPVSPD